MERISLSLPEGTRRRLRLLASERGISVATLIREAIEEKIDRMSHAPSSLGVGASGVSETAGRIGNQRPEPRSWR